MSAHENVALDLEPMGRELDNEVLGWYENAPEYLGVPSWWFEKGDDRTFDSYAVQTSDYTSADFFQLEQTRLWPRVWSVACRANDIPNVGDHLTYELAGYSLLIVRAAPSTFNAFHNACRHRGRALVDRNGNSECFVCPFHGWTYGLDGALQKIPAHWDFPHVDARTTGLQPVQVQEFDGWLFVNMDPTAAPLEDHLGEVTMRHLTSQPVRRDSQLWKQWHYGLTVNANWKVMAEAFFEVYHVNNTHPQLMPHPVDFRHEYLGSQFSALYGLHHRAWVVDYRPRPERTDADMIKRHLRPATREVLALPDDEHGQDGSSSTIPIPDGVRYQDFVGQHMREFWASKGVDVSAATDVELTGPGGSNLYFIFPNIVTFRGPTGHITYRFRPHPSDPNWSIFEMMMLVALPDGKDLPPDAPLEMMPVGETFLSSECAAKMGQELAYILDQDVLNGPSIQKGLHSVPRNLLSQTMEQNIVAFHHNLRTFMKPD